MPTVEELISSLTRRKQGQNQTGYSIPQVSSKPFASVSKITPQGQTIDIFNPALEQAKEGVKGVVETQQAMRALESVFEKAERDIPAAQEQSDAFKQGIRRGAGKFTMFGVTPAQAFGAADEGAMSYGQTKEAFGTQIARGLGERGVVTNQDVERIFKALPKDNDTVSVRENNKTFIRKILTDRISQYNQIYSALKAKKSQRAS